MPKEIHLASPKMIAELVEQYNKELYSYLVYLQLAAIVERDNYIGFAKFFKKRAEEELVHSNKFFEFISDVNGLAQVKAMKEPKVNDDSLLGLFKQALDHEQFITDSISKLYEMSLKGKQHTAANFLLWFINEQVEEESSLDVIISNLERSKGNEAAILSLQEDLVELISGD